MLQTPDTNGYDNVTFNTKFYYDGYYNRLKQVVYADRYSVENLYTKYGALEMQRDAVTQLPLMQIQDWNEKGQETIREFNGLSTAFSQTEYYPSTGQVKKITNGTNGDDEILDYAYDAWGNIQQQSLNRAHLGVNNLIATEIFSYDKLHRLKTAAVNGIQKSYVFDNIGNITSKSDFSNNYSYGNNANCNATANAGPNAVCAASLISGGMIRYNYDNKGNRVNDSIDAGNTANYQYDYNNLLIESTSSITGQLQKLQFNYGPDNQRYRKFDEINNEITLYANKDYERIYKNGFLNEQKYYITSYLTLTKVNQTGELKKNFMQKDRLGSTTQILDENGIVLHTKSYDAFGKPRNGDWSETASLFQAKLDFNDTSGTIDLTKRGFTDHEHLDEMQLIHMNGRMYDYNNGRFLSVDPFIASPSSTQTLNPYTYVLNNPLSGTDPSGYFVKYLAMAIRIGGRFLKDFNPFKKTREPAPATTEPVRPPGYPIDAPYIPPNPGFKPADPSETVLSQPIADPQNNTESLPIADPSSTSTEGPALDNGNQNSNQGTMMNENGGDTSETESESKAKDRSRAKRRAGREAQRGQNIPTSKPGENLQNPSDVDQPRHQIKTGSDGQTVGVVDGSTDTNHDESHVEAGDVKEAEPINKHNQPRLKNSKTKVEYDPDKKVQQGGGK